MTRGSLFKICGIGLGVLLGLFVLLSLNFWLRARTNFEQAETARARGDVQLAVAHYDQSIRNYSLFNPYGRLAKERLLAVAADYEKAQDLRAALDAYQTLLSALSAVETGLSPNLTLVERLETRIATLREQVAR